MGNTGSSSRDQQAASVCSNGQSAAGAETGNRGWSQSFPRELARHRSQPSAARKVLPEPPNQRLRATNNGTIIHNGGTISGRRAPTFASSRDLAKRNEPPFRERSGSASNLVDPRSKRTDRPCCRYRSDAGRSDAVTTSSNLKKFGSEPDLRCSPELACPSSPDGTSGARDDARPSSSCHRYARDAKERLESRYKARKKYKAPAPPATESSGRVGELVSGSSPDAESRCSRDVESHSHSHPHPHSHSHSHSHANSRLEQPHHHHQVQPPPRRSRLFKTRAESKKAQVSWQLSASGIEREHSRHEHRESVSRWSCAFRSRTEQHSESGPLAGWQDRARDPRGSKPSERANGTLQRSMSSPEFQAELIQVARRVRDKLDSDESRRELIETEAGSFSRSRQRSEAEDRREKERARRCDDWPTVESPTTLHDLPDASPNEPREIHESVNRDAVAKPDQRQRSYESSASKARPAKDAAGAGRGYGSGESPQRQRLASNGNSDSGKFAAPRTQQLLEQKWPDPGLADSISEKDPPPENPHTERFASTAQFAPKTFYFGMNEGPSSEPCPDERRESGREASAFRKAPDREHGKPATDTADDTDDNERNVVENISLKLRPTLPKKQLEIPRFSPSAAWRLLSALEAPGPSMSTASEEMPVMFEERIERLSRPPPPFPLSLGPRSWHDKSGDSGISGDAGAANEDSLDVSTINRMKTTATRPTWTPQQDLGEESSSDAGVDSPSPLPTPLKYHSPRAHVFSLSLPRDDTRAYLCTSDTKTREPSAFNSLQKLKRSVSGAFGIGSHDHSRKCTRDLLDDNWLLSTSAPTSLQHNHVRMEAARTSPSVWSPFSRDDRLHLRDETHRDRGDQDQTDDVDRNLIEDEVDGEGDGEREIEAARMSTAIESEQTIQASDFPVIMKPPSFSYLTPGGHVMYLPEANEGEHRVQNFRGRSVRANAYDDGDADEDDEEMEDMDEDRDEDEDADDDGEDEDEVEDDEDEGSEKMDIPSRRRSKSLKDEGDPKNSRGCANVSSCDESRENVGQSKQKRSSSFPLDPVDRQQSASSDAKGTKGQRKSGSKSKRFTFQSTVRQIERRRLAEKLSREVEAKERQRKGELEAMRKVEEEFQRKRAKEKANIRQQLRLFKEMEENFNNLPTPDWDASQLSRADPDGAPSSTASSPTSLPGGSLSTCAPASRKSYAEDELPRKKLADSDSSKHARVQRKAYPLRPKYYDWSPDTSSHLDCRQTTVHPKIVCDIPKSSPVFVDANVHPGKPVTSNSTPKSDNYRKDFAHGTVATRTSFASSDSELSLPNTRPPSRQTGINGKLHRARSGSPRRSEEPASSEEDSPGNLLEPTKHPRNPTHDFILNGVQPFTKRKAYRPISFNPRPPPPIPS